MFYLGSSLLRNTECLVLLCMLVKLFFCFEVAVVFVSSVAHWKANFGVGPSHSDLHVTKLLIRDQIFYQLW